MFTNSVLIDAILPQIDNKTKAIARDVALVLGFAILTGICAKFKIEIGPIPITMQTFAVLVSGVLLGSKRGATSQITYLLGGLMGLPWFSRGGGLAYILSPTFGYILGFVFAAYSVGYLAEKGWDRNIKTAILVMFIGNIIIYIPGLLYLIKFVGLKSVLIIGFYPFILGDILKIALAGLLLPLAWKILNHQRISNRKGFVIR